MEDKIEHTELDVQSEAQDFSTDEDIEVEKLELDSAQLAEEKAQEADTKQGEVEKEPIGDFEAKYNELKDKYLRAMADFENTKKRIEREKYHSLEYANEAFGTDLLSIFDALQKALESVDSAVGASTNGGKNGAKAENNAIKDGLNLVMQNFLKVLAKYGIEPISVENGFDPNMHNCVMHIKDQSKEDGAIGSVFQTGFKYKERLLRPAMLSVVKNS